MIKKYQKRKKFDHFYSILGENSKFFIYLKRGSTKGPPPTMHIYALILSTLISQSLFIVKDRRIARRWSELLARSDKTQKAVQAPGFFLTSSSFLQFSSPDFVASIELAEFLLVAFVSVLMIILLSALKEINFTVVFTKFSM